jgi:hypothetical protein
VTKGTSLFSGLRARPERRIRASRAIRFRSVQTLLPAWKSTLRRPPDDDNSIEAGFSDWPFAPPQRLPLSRSPRRDQSSRPNPSNPYRLSCEAADPELAPRSVFHSPGNFVAQNPHSALDSALPNHRCSVVPLWGLRPLGINTPGAATAWEAYQNTTPDLPSLPESHLLLSLPMPTLSPACIRVPRWRTMMLR